MWNCPEIIAEIQGRVGFLTLNRPKALNALTLPMIRALTAALLRWRDDPNIAAVAIRGMGREGPFGMFCAGGDIRFFHQAALAGDPVLEEFFTEEYALNHLIHAYPKPYLAFMDGIVMGGGMGISQGASMRIVTQHSKLGMPETYIGLFPDVGGGYFLSRLRGAAGEWLALTGQVLGAGPAVALGLADNYFPSQALPAAWAALADLDWSAPQALATWLAAHELAVPADNTLPLEAVDAYFSLESLAAIMVALEADSSAWASQTAISLRLRSPLMLHVALEQIRRARGLSLVEDLRMERDLVRHCFFTRHLARSGASSETVEGIRAMAIDKDHQAHWQPARIEDVTPEMVAPFFVSPWPPTAHPLRGLG